MRNDIVRVTRDFAKDSVLNPIMKKITRDPTHTASVGKGEKGPRINSLRLKRNANEDIKKFITTSHHLRILKS